MTLFLCGMGAMLGLLVMLGAGYMLGQRNTPKAIARPPTDTHEQEERKRIEKQLAKEFTMVMGYNEQKAYERKQV